jgi:hypothetical protein
VKQGSQQAGHYQRENGDCNEVEGRLAHEQMDEKAAVRRKRICFYYSTLTSLILGLSRFAGFWFDGFGFRRA